MCKTAERFDVLVGVETPGDAGKIVLDGGPIPHGEGEGFNVAVAKLLQSLFMPLLVRIGK